MKGPRIAAAFAVLAVAGGVAMSVLAVTKSNTPNSERMRVVAGLPKPERLAAQARKERVCLVAADDDYIFRDGSGRLSHVTPEQVAATIRLGLGRGQAPPPSTVVRVAEELELGFLFRDEVAC